MDGTENMSEPMINESEARGGSCDPAPCSAMNDVPYTNMKTGQMLWKQEPCGSTAMPDSKYCLMHQYIEKRERAMSESLMASLKASGSWPNESSSATAGGEQRSK